MKISRRDIIMRAIQFSEYGSPEVLQLVDVDAPSPGKGELKIKTLATGVNPADFKWRGGLFQQVMPLQLPHIVGYDVAGVVSEVGEDVTDFRVGDRVTASVQRGYAEFVTTPASFCAKVPDDLEIAEAAALPCAALTGVQLIEDGLRPTPGQTVLITGAVGSVGRFAVHAALSLGVRVVAAVRPSQFDEVRAMGVDTIIDLGSGTAGDLSFDHVADTVGGPAVAGLCKNLVPGGSILTVATTPVNPEGLAATPTFFGFHPDGERLAALIRDVVSGKVSMPVARRLPLTDAAEAHRLAEAGGLGGKVILIL
jgi:NADPH:quinone reductase-like Zn-dependent oxidoreductase